MQFRTFATLPMLAALTFTFSAASAQTAPNVAQTPMAQAGGGQRSMPSPQEMAQHQTQRLTKELNLSADQSSKVQQILQQRAQDMQAMRAQDQPGTDRQQMRQQMQANRAKYDEQLKGVLTPDQFTKYSTLEAEHRHHGEMTPGTDGKIEKFKAKEGDLKIKTKES